MAGYNYIMVVVDKLTQCAQFILLDHPFIAWQVVHTYLTHIFKLHGLPQSIISDRHHIFTSNLWNGLFRLAGTQLTMNSAYHPQVDGQTERINQFLCFVHSSPNKWHSWLALAEFWYNTTYHFMLGLSPFEALYGHAPHHFGIVDSWFVLMLIWLLGLRSANSS